MARALSFRNVLSVYALLNVAVAAVLLSASCEKSADKPAEQSEARAQPAAAVKVAADEATPIAKAPANAETASDEGYSCGDPDKHAAGKDGSGGSESGGCNQWDEAAAEVIERDVPKDAIWTTLKVTGMTCGGCERRIIANLGGIDGVYAVEADAELGQVRLAVDKSKPKLASVAAERIGSLGYRVQ